MPSGCAPILTSFISITTSSRAWSGYENGRGRGPKENKKGILPVLLNLQHRNATRQHHSIAC